MYPLRRPEVTREDYNREYNNGWRAGARFSGLDGIHTDAWEDGYLDYATDRPKWHLRECTDHDNCP